MIDKILSYIKKNKLIESNSKVLIGLSGGPDSVFLLHVLNKLKNELEIDLIAGHLDHEWRKNSNLDEQFCQKICEQLKIQFFSKKASELNFEFKHRGSKEDLGRQMRRYFLEQLAKEQTVNKIALAHHLQDQEENFFIRLIRGSTLSGLVGMKAQDGIYVRPLLEINKKDIISFLDENKIEYILDPSNESPEFLRNRIRNNVIPRLQECDSRFDDNFLRTINKLRETENFIESIVNKSYEQISDDQNFIDLTKFFKYEEFLQKKLIFYWLYKSQVKFELTEQFINEILRFLKQPSSGKHQLNPNWFIQKEKNKAVIKTLI